MVMIASGRSGRSGNGGGGMVVATVFGKTHQHCTCDTDWSTGADSGGGGVVGGQRRKEDGKKEMQQTTTSVAH